MRGRGECFNELLAYIETVPVIDTHDHTMECGPKNTDPIQAVFGGYYQENDLDSSLPNLKPVSATLMDAAIPLEQRWPLLERAWKRCKHTGYAQVTRRVLKRFYGEDEVSLEALQRIREKLIDLSDAATFENILAEAGIVMRLTDMLPLETPPTQAVLDGTLELPPRSRMVIPLPFFHKINCVASVGQLIEPLDRWVASLDEYLEACREIFKIYRNYGAVAFKDQSAYWRPIRYDTPTRTAAEEVFNWFMSDPRRVAAVPDGIKPLSDYLFNEFMRMAREMDLPVQLHTGHLAGNYDDVSRANAINLASLLERHREVRFDLFHASWPYGGEFLFLGKNYPNVTLNFCWANIIDPVYSQNLFRQALSSVPHGKIHGHGSDYIGYADRAWAHTKIARENIAIALAGLVEIEYLDLDEAKAVAQNWLFDNPNTFFRLGLH